MNQEIETLFEVLKDFFSILKDFSSVLAIFVGGIWSWHQFLIGDILKPNFTFSVDIRDIEVAKENRLVIIQVTVKNIGKVTIEHKSSQLRIYPIQKAEFTSDGTENPDTICTMTNLGNTKPITIDEPFSPVYCVPENWENPSEKMHKQPFILRPGEQVTVDIPVVVAQESITALRVISSFHCTKAERARIMLGNGQVSKKKIPYGAYFQSVLSVQANSQN